MRYRELTKRLKKMGCYRVRPGKDSHTLWHNPATNEAAVIPDWGGKDIPPGTVPGHPATIRDRPKGFWPNQIKPGGFLII